MTDRRFRRILSGLLAAVLLLSNVPVVSFAALGGLCPHHETHGDCGYREAVAGTDCNHICTEECYEAVTECVHSHGDCGYRKAEAAIPCDHGHDVFCGYVEKIPSQEDRREIHLRVTEKYMRYWNESSSTMHRAVTILEERFSKEEMAVFTRMLETLAEALPQDQASDL